MHTYLVQIIMARKECVFLYKKVAADAKDPSLKEPMPPLTGPLTGQEQRRLDELEEELPLQTIVMFRTMARREVRALMALLVSCRLLVYWRSA